MPLRWPARFPARGSSSSTRRISPTLKRHPRSRNRFRSSSPMSDDAKRDAGMAVRRQILGHAHVDRAVARADALTNEFQELLTRYVWGEIWTRPGLDHRT